MEHHYHQVDLSHWRRGVERPVAVVELEPADLERRCKLRFAESHDELDALLGALIETPSGKQFALVRHRGSPSAGTEVWARADSPDAARDLREFLAALGLDERALTWTAPEISRALGQPQVTLTVLGISEGIRDLVADLQPILGVDHAERALHAAAHGGAAFVQLVGTATAWVAPLRDAAAAFLKPFLAQLGKKAADQVWEKRDRVREVLSTAAAAPIRKVVSALMRTMRLSAGAQLQIGIPLPQRDVGAMITLAPSDEEEAAWVLACFVAKVEEIEAAMRAEVAAGRAPVGCADLTLQVDGGFAVRWRSVTDGVQRRFTIK